MYTGGHSTATISPSNGLRYPLVGGTRQRRFAGTNFKPRNVPENAQTPTSMAPAKFAGDRVQPVVGALMACNIHWLTKLDIFFIAHNLRCPTFESLF